MRTILIERARHRQAVRHGGQQRVEFDQVQLPFASDDDQLLVVNEALERLAAVHPEEAEVVKLRYFAGLTHEEAADALGISVRNGEKLLGARPDLVVPGDHRGGHGPIAFNEAAATR